MSKSKIHRAVIAVVAIFSWLTVLQCSDSPQGPESDPEQAHDFELAAVMTDDGIELTWNLLDEPSCDCYHLYRSESADSGFAAITSLPPDSGRYLDSAIIASLTYYYYVAALDSAGNETDTSLTQPATVTGAKICLSPDVCVAPWFGGASCEIAVTNCHNIGSISWTIGGSTGWIRMEPVQGTTPGSITVATDSNLTASPRYGIGLIRGDGLTTQVVTVEQKALFGSPVEFVTGVHPSAVAAADFDGDGVCDLAVSSEYEYRMDIFISNGDGSFKERSRYSSGGETSSMITADFDGDGDYDLAMTSYYGIFSTSIYLLRNNGDGTFAHPVVIGGPRGSDLESADLDADGDLDLIMLLFYGGVGIFLNEGDGTFADMVGYATEDGPSSLCVVDVDGDSGWDLAITNGNLGNLSILHNNGDGTFTPAGSYAAGETPNSICAADFDGDGDQDFAVTSLYSATMSIISSNGDGTFSTPATNSIGGMVCEVISADIDGDSDDDLVISNGEFVAIMRNDGHGAFADPIFFESGGGGAFRSGHIICAANFDGDTGVDIAGISVCYEHMWVLRNNSL